MWKGKSVEERENRGEEGMLKEERYRVNGNGEEKGIGKWCRGKGIGLGNKKEEVRGKWEEEGGWKGGGEHWGWGNGRRGIRLLVPLHVSLIVRKSAMCFGH